MDFSKLARRLRAKVVRFSGELCSRLGKTAGRFVVEGVYGILSSQSVLLTEMGRSLEDDVSLKKIEERFCRQLAKPGLWEKLHRALLGHASPKISDDTLLVMDISDIQKKYAKKMEYVTEVWDGSEEVIGKGYWTLQVIGAHVKTKEIVPLYHSLYSQDSPGFKSENEEILNAISLVSSYTDKRGIWVIDRGADRERLFYPLLKGDHRFIIRLVGMRDLLYRRVPVNSLKMALWCPCPYNDTIIRTEHGKEKSYSVQYGFLPVRLPGHPKTPLWLFVMRGLGAKPLMLLTTQPLRRNRQVLKNLFLSYVRRWSIEETIRFVKQTYDLENIRVLRYVCLKNMMALVLIVFYFLAVVLDTHQKLKILSGHVLDAAKRVFGIPDFKYYALGDGICAIFIPSGRDGRIRPKPPKPSVWQLSLKYT